MMFKQFLPNCFKYLKEKIIKVQNAHVQSNLF